MALFCVVSAKSGSFRAHCVKVHVRYLISWWVLVHYGRMLLFKAKFHYAIWFEAGRRPAVSWNLAYHLDGQTHRRAWPQYILRRLRLTQTVTSTPPYTTKTSQWRGSDISVPPRLLSWPLLSLDKLARRVLAHDSTLFTVHTSQHHLQLQQQQLWDGSRDDDHQWIQRREAVTRRQYSMS